MYCTYVSEKVICESMFINRRKHGVYGSKDDTKRCSYGNIGQY